MGIYKLDKIKEFKYESLDGMQCERVILNESLSKKYGNLYIDRKLYNSTGINIHTINGLLCSNLNFLQKDFIVKLHDFYFIFFKYYIYFLIYLKR